MTQELPLAPNSDSAENTSIESILIRKNGSAPEKHPLDGQVVTIGRDERNNVVLDTDGVSRLHARLECEQGTWYITDLGSTNGTFLNTEKLPSYAPHLVAAGDRMHVGDVRLEFYRAGQTFGSNGGSTAVVSPEFAEDEESVAAISLARQLFSGVEDQVVDPPTDAAQAEIDAIEALEALKSPMNPPVPPVAEPLPRVTEPEPVAPLSESTTRFELPSLANESILSSFGSMRTLSDALAQRSEQPKLQPFSTSVWPTVLIQSGQVVVSILNESNKTRHFTVELAVMDGVESGEGVFSAEIAAGAERRTALNIHATTRPFFGESADYPFQIVVNRDQADERVSDGIVRVEPRFTTAMAAFGTGAVLLSLAAWLASFLF